MKNTLKMKIVEGNIVYETMISAISVQNAHHICERMLKRKFSEKRLEKTMYISRYVANSYYLVRAYV